MSERKLPTPDQWAQIEKELRYLWGQVDLRIDGYTLQLRVRPIAPLKFGIMVFVDDHFRGEWLTMKDGEWCEEARRFLLLRRKHLYRAAVRQRFEKAVGKRRAAKESIMTTMYESRNFYWTSFGALKRHLLANNYDIELFVEEAVTS